MLRKICISLSVLALAACGGGGGDNSPTTPPVGNTPVPSGGVSVRNNAFSPAAKTVPVGQAVSWSWNSCDNDPYYGTTCVQHSVTFDDGVSSGLQDQGTFTRTFTAPGTYNYHCLSHGTAMTGTITVQ